MTIESASLDAVLEERAARHEAPAEEAPAPEPAPEAELPAGEEVPAEPAEAPPEGEETPAEEPPAPAAEAPHYWTAEQKARFAELPADLQSVLAEQEKGRERAVQQAQQQAAEARKAAEAEKSQLTQFATQAGEIFQRAEAAFNRSAPEVLDEHGQPDRLVDANGRPMRWEDVNWTEWLRVEPDRAGRFRNLYAAELATMQQLDAARRQTHDAALGQHIQQRDAKLAELAHPLADPTDGPRRKSELADYLVAQGIPQDQLPAFSAEAMTLAWKAKQWDDAQAKAQARPAPTPNKPAAPAPVRPVSQGPSSAPRNLIALEAKAEKTGSLDDVLAARAARRALQHKG